MNRTATFGLLGVIALVATLGVSLQPGTNRGGEGSSTDHRGNFSQARKEPSKTSETNSQLICDDIAETLQIFVAVDQVPRPRSCFDSDALYDIQNVKPTLGAQLPLRFVVATLPDPIHTHLPLMFDRMTEVIQEAAQDEKYSYEASWLPWDDKEQMHPLLADEDQAADRKKLRENQPGLLLFRNGSTTAAHQKAAAIRTKPEENTPSAKTSKPNTEPANPSDEGLLPYREGLLVFVVGEDPTRGIHTEQFENALAWIKELKRLDLQSRAPAAILGPTFSGSFPSLTKLLSSGKSAQYLMQIRDNSSPPLAIYTGSANSRPAITRFEDANLGIDFHAFLERDQVSLERFCELIGKQIDRDDAIAVLSEDETSFGSENEPDLSSDGKSSCLKNSLWLYYPRDMSNLRAAYQTNSTFKTATPQPSGDSNPGRLPIDLADPEGQEHDTIRSYSGNQMPLSQEAYLLGIVNVMRAHHIQYVILRTTNVLDQLFLVRYLRRAYPDARIVTDGADRLFEREPSTTAMGATMSVSTYPLLERQQQWIIGKPLTGGQRSFNSDTSEGTYVALRFLLHAPSLSENGTDPCTLKPGAADVLPALPEACNLIPDYGVPSWLKPVDPVRQPPTWVSVLGRDGYWAIAALDEKTTQHTTGERDRSDREAPSDIPLILRIWMICLAGFSSFHIWCCWRASFTAKPAFRTHFANPGDRRHTLLVFLGSCFAATLPLLVGWGCGIFDSSSATIPPPWWVSTVVVLECAIAFAGSVANVFRLEQLATRAETDPAAKRRPPWQLIALLCGGSALWIILYVLGFALPLQCRMEPANRFFTYYRSMHLLTGVSPMVPLLALTFGMYLWFWHSLHGLALFGPDRCTLPKECDLDIADPDDHSVLHVLRMFSDEHSASGTESEAKPMSRGAGIFAAASFLIMLTIVLLVSRNWPVRSLGAKYYSIFFLSWVLVCFSLMLMEAWQLLRTWNKLRELLMFLDRMPLRRTLAALRGFSWGSVWTMSGNVLDVRYKLLSRQLESTGHARSALNDLATKIARDRAHSCVAARDCIDLLTNLQQAEKADERRTLAHRCLHDLEKLSKSTTGDQRAKIDKARDCIASQPLGTVAAGSAASAAIQDCISTLEQFVSEPVVGAVKESIDALDNTHKLGKAFAIWYANHYKDPDAGDFKSLEDFQSSVAKTAALLLTHVLLAEWREEKETLVLEEGQPDDEGEGGSQMPPPLSKKQYIRDAEEFVCLPYLGFVQNILGRMRSMVMSILWLFVATALAISSYPFDPRQGLSGAMAALFILLGAIIFNVYAQMHKDTTLSHVTNTTPGKLGGEFWFKLLGFGFAPLLGLLTTIFPGIADFVFSWLQPGLQSLK
jgi:hypothetical protein